MTTMDHDRERDRLVAALRHKLSELDARVVAYRRERADEFRRYAVDLLTPVADDAVATAVAGAIEGKPDSDTDTKLSLASKTDSKIAQTYPALFPGFLDNAGDDSGDHNRSILAPPPHARTLPRRTASPPPVLYHTSGVPKEGPRRPPTDNAPEASPSLHARDDDFRGVFTPPFLPLLDGWSYDRRSSGDMNNTTRNNNDASASGAAAAAATAKADAAEAAAATKKAAAENEAAETKAAEVAAADAADAEAAETAATEAAAAAAATPPPPPPEPKLKSALRRISSYSSSRSSTRSNTPTFNSPAANTSNPTNTNTRHVRFSFNGEEVLPTASPPREHEQDLSWLMHDDRSNHSGGGGHSSMNIYDYSRHYHNATAGSGSGSGAFSSFSSPGLDSPSPSAHGNLTLGATALSAGPLSHSSLPGNEAEAGTAGPNSNSTSASTSAAGDQTTPLSPQPEKQQNQLRNESHSESQSSRDTSSSFAQTSSTPTSTSNSNSHQDPPPRPPQPRRRHSQILDDDEDEFVPLSRKVSSSDRLRALSKMPLEDPSMWTVVNPQADAAAAAAGNNANDSAGSSAPTSDTDLAAATAANRGNNLVYQPSPAASSSSYRDQAPSPPTVEQREYAADNSYNSYNSYDSDASSDEDEGFIAMRPSRGKSPKPAAPAASTTPTTTPAANGTTADVNSTRPKQSTSSDKVQVTYASTNGSSGRKKTAAAAEEDDFFGFEPDGMDGDDEDGAVGYPLSRVTDVNTHFDDDEDEYDVDAHDEDVDETDAPVDDKDLVQKKKAALGIGTDGLDSMDLVFNRHKPIVNNREGESALSSSLSASRKGKDGQLDGAAGEGDEQPSLPGPASISVGSYRGKPIDLFNVVKDPRILQQAAQMGALNSFVGSVHDHETHAPANMAEFSSLSGREQLNLLSGTPRSLTERMVMEDTRAFFSPSKR